jgi:glucose-6-phosphate dehydrogenase assembly protein OpcA
LSATGAHGEDFDRMASSISNLSVGIPVEIGRIDRELNNLWESGGGAMTRASMINFAVYCEGIEAMRMNTALIAEFMQDQACRAILIGVEPNAPEQKVQAWISAHCHISRAGAKQVCCEQLTFLLEGPSQEFIPNIVFSHLDSDLPLYLWWRAEFPEPINERLWTWVDRLIFDSQKWDAPLMEFRRLRASFARIKPRMTLCDLNWARSIFVRDAIAQIFDRPENLECLPGIERAWITHSPAHRSTAVLVAGWFMAQLGWSIAQHSGDQVTFVQPQSQRHVEFEFRQKEGPALSECCLEGAGASFRIANENTSGFLHGDVRMPDGHEYHHLLRSGRDETLDLLEIELMRGSKHRMYLRALSAVEPLL